MTNYAEQHNLKTKGAILQRIEELKRNTFPNKQLIEELENMTFLDEVVETNNSTRHKSRHGETHRELVFPKDAVLNRIALAEKLKEDYLDKMYFNNPNLMTQKEFEEAVKKDTVNKEVICEENCVIYNPSNLFSGEKKLTSEQLKEGIQEGVDLLNKIKRDKESMTITYLGTISEGVEEIKKARLTDDFIKAATDRREEAYKENNGKIDYSEIDFDIIDLMARRFNVNKHKYSKGNMLKPIDENQLLMALYRHWRKMFQPIPNDEETFEEHLAAILCNAQMIYQQRKIKNEQRETT